MHLGQQAAEVQILPLRGRADQGPEEPDPTDSGWDLSGAQAINVTGQIVDSDNRNGQTPAHFSTMMALRRI